MKCQHDGCDNPGEECTLKNEQGVDVTDGYYCGSHAADHGFCPVCGDFWGGISSFEMNGMCDHCRDELRKDDPEEFWDGEYDDGPIGSCGNCGVNLYADDEHNGLCGQCEWFLMQNMQEERGSE